MRHLPLLAAAFLLVAAPATARAAACCLSTSAFGTGRLAVWEEAAVGANLAYSTSTGLFDSEGAWKSYRDYAERETRLIGFGLFRLAPTLEAGARFPWVFGSREAGGRGEAGNGPGDLALSLRWQAIELGEFAGIPGIALTAGATLPTGRSMAETRRLLGADVTGLGYTVLSAGLSVERAHDPFFVRLDAAALLPLAYESDGVRYRRGPGIEVLVGGGADVGRGVVLALTPRIRWDSDGFRDGERLPDSSTLELALGASAAWQFDPHWTLQASFESGIPADGFGRSRPLFTSGSIGIRHGIY